MIIVAFILWLAGCNNQQPAANGPPPAEVTVSKPEQKEVVNWNEFTGRTDRGQAGDCNRRGSAVTLSIFPLKKATLSTKAICSFKSIRARIRMLTTRRLASCSRRKPISNCRMLTFTRQQRLRQTGVIAKEDYDTAMSNKDQAAAQVVSAQAARNSAQLNLEFTHVTSPIDGRVSRQLVNIGNLVQADSTQLTTIVSIDPIYAYFSMDELAALSYQRLIREGKLASSEGGKIPVYLQLQDETGFPHEGTIDFSDNSFDPTTGTLLIRGSFPNSDGFLTPGNFVRVRVASGPKYNALLVADRAIGSDQDQSFVYVLDSKNIARLRHIKTGQLAEGLRVVKSGLQPDDVVIINGIIKVRPDSPVKPQPGAMEQFSSNDISMPLTSSQSSASHGDADRNKATP